MGTKKIVIEVSDEVHAQLGALGASLMISKPGDVERVVAHLVHSAADGVRRPGAWERGWLYQAFGDDWLSEVEPVPDLGYRNDRPKNR